MGYRCDLQNIILVNSMRLNFVGLEPFCAKIWTNKHEPLYFCIDKQQYFACSYHAFSYFSHN